MSKVESGELRVPAICNGSVIDHIPVEHLMKVVEILKVDTLTHPITMGLNFASKKLGKKGIIKVENKHFTPEEVNVLALITPELVINVIENYKVVRKIQAVLPDEIEGIVRCTNPKCISNNEEMTPRYTVLDKHSGTLKCHYCNRRIEHNEIEIKEEGSR